MMCDELGDAAGLPRLLDLLQVRGVSTAALTKLAHGNFLRVMDRHLHT
jgi:microsomal dipeptidase-like Zn-dependent dipeptidase